MNAHATTQNWFILRGDTQYGPYDYAAMIQLIQKNELYDYNYVWSEHLDGWTPMGELPEFSRDRFARIIENNLPVKSAFITRGAPRVDTKIPVYGHNNRAFFDGTVLSLSENGALILLNTPLLNPQDEINLHFRECDENGTPFNIKATVVRKNFNRKRLNVKSGLTYAVRFDSVNDLASKELHNLVHTKLGG